MVWLADCGPGWEVGYLGGPVDLDLAGYLAGCLRGYLTE